MEFFFQFLKMQNTLYYIMQSSYAENTFKQ